MKTRFVLVMAVAIGIAGLASAEQPMAKLYAGKASLPLDAEARIDPRTAASTPVPCVREIKVKEGQKVKKGDVIAVLGHLPDHEHHLLLEMKQREALLKSAKAVLANAKAHHDRMEKLGNVTSPHEMERSHFAYDKAKADAAAAELALELAKSNAQPVNLVAPRDGIVRDIKFRQGSAAVAFTDGTPWALVVDESRLQVTVRVPRADVAKYAIGTKLTVRCEAVQCDRPGVVEQVIPKVDDAGGVPVVISIPNGDHKVFVGDVLTVDPVK